MGVHVVGNRGFFKPGLGLTRIFLMTLLGLLYDGPASLWANPTIGDESESHQIWNFDNEMARTHGTPSVRPGSPAGPPVMPHDRGRSCPNPSDGVTIQTLS